MENWQVTGWWICFIIFSVCIQALAPGIDVLVVGIIILMQEKDYRAMLFLLPLFCFLQEGMGTTPFGTIMIWYAAVILLFIIGQWLFEASNFIFIFLLSACLGISYFGIFWVMTHLQGLSFDVGAAMDKSLAQAVFMPFAWWMLVTLKKMLKKTEET